jgi:hypothetical protein
MRDPLVEAAGIPAQDFNRRGITVAWASVRESPEAKGVCRGESPRHSLDVPPTDR